MAIPEEEFLSRSSDQRQAQQRQSASRHFIGWFCLFVVLHIGLFLALPFSFASFDDRIAWFSVNALPWYPLHQIGLPVTSSGWLTLPNAIGWVWCLAVWLGFYAVLAKAAAYLTLRHRGPVG